MEKDLREAKVEAEMVIMERPHLQRAKFESLNEYFSLPQSRVVLNICSELFGDFSDQ